jgi:hypothetical protein
MQSDFSIQLYVYFQSTCTCLRLRPVATGCPFATDFLSAFCAHIQSSGMAPIIKPSNPTNTAHKRTASIALSSRVNLKNKFSPLLDLADTDNDQSDIIEIDLGFHSMAMPLAAAVSKVNLSSAASSVK